MLSFSSELPLPVSGAETYRGMAFDGCRYYLTVRCARAVVVLNRDLSLVQKKVTRRPYTALCYDPMRDCFWAASDQCRATLFRLGRNLQEIDRLIPQAEGRCSEPITDISFCCGSGRLLVSRGNQILDLDPDNGSTVLRYEARGTFLILSAVCLSSDILIHGLRSCEAYFALVSCGGEARREQTAPEGVVLLSMVLDPRTYDLRLLTNKRGCYPYLLGGQLEQEIRAELGPDIRDCYCGCGEQEPCDPSCTSTDVLSSAVLVETAIAHILNTEGEKLQKAVKEAVSPGELLKVDKSVQRTILYAAQLEQLMLAKLEVLQCSNGCEEPKDGTA